MEKDGSSVTSELSKQFIKGNDLHAIDMRIGFDEGYSKAKETYKYTEEDLKNAFNEGYSIRDSYGDNSNNMTADEYIQSLQQPKLPIAFECKMNITHCDRCPDGFERWPKTITNSQGRTEWVGKYIY